MRPDEQAIVDLTIRYAWALDERNFEDLREVFAPDATASLLQECEGIDAIIARISGALTPLDASHHMVTNHQVVIDGDRATCRCYLQAQHTRYGLEGGENYWLAGTYSDDLARTADGWRIVRRVLTTVWREGNLAVIRRTEPPKTPRSG